MDPVGQHPQLLEDPPGDAADLREQRGGRLVARLHRVPLAASHLERERQQELLRSVVEIPLELTTRGITRFHDASPRSAQLVQRPLELQLETLVLDGEPRLRADLRLDEVGWQGTVMQHDRDPLGRGS